MGVSLVKGTYYAFVPPAIDNTEVRTTVATSSFHGTVLGVMFHWVDENNWYGACIDGTRLLVQKKDQRRDVDSCYHSVCGNQWHNVYPLCVGCPFGSLREGVARRKS